MIPGDLAARLRMLTEASFFDSEPPVSGTARVRELQARLPELVPGEKFTATLQRALPDGTFRALVAGKTYTLALNHAAKSGDTLELVVTGSSPKAVFAQLANPAASAATASGDTAGRATLSTTGRLISFLLTGQPASQPAPLAAGKPLLAAPPAAGGAALAPILRQALTQSGLFYESHQLQWLSGRIATAALLQEPQGQQPPMRPFAGDVTPSEQSVATGASLATARLDGTGTSASPAMAKADVAAAGFIRPAGGTPATAPGLTPDSAVEGADLAKAASLSTAQAPRTPIVPERLVPIVHQQLDAMATQNYVWQGQVWPGQHVEWEIEDPERDRNGGGEDVPESWNTTLRLTLPRLGGVEARLTLSSAGVALRMLADDPATVATLTAERARLDATLAAANVPLTSFVAERRNGDR